MVNIINYCNNNKILFEIFRPEHLTKYILASYNEDIYDVYLNYLVSIGYKLEQSLAYIIEILIDNTYIDPKMTKYVLTNSHNYNKHFKAVCYVLLDKFFRKYNVDIINISIDIVIYDRLDRIIKLTKENDLIELLKFDNNSLLGIEFTIFEKILSIINRKLNKYEFINKALFNNGYSQYLIK